MEERPLGQHAGELGDVDERRLRLVEIATEVLQRGALVLAVAFLGVELNESASLLERDEWDFEAVTNTRSHVSTWCP